MVCCNMCLFNVKLSADIPKNLILEFCSIITENTRSRVGVYEMENNGMSHCCSSLFRQGSQEVRTTKMVDTNNDIGRTIVVVQQL